MKQPDYPSQRREIAREAERRYRAKHGNARKRQARATMPGWYKAQSAKYRKNHPEKAAAQRKVNKRIEHSKWPKASVFLCSDCPKPAQEYHHEDYSLWWSIEPLCKCCHAKRHSSEGSPEHVQQSLPGL